MIKIVAIDGGYKKDKDMGISVLYTGDNYHVNVEKGSTVQRAEINGLILALRYAVQVSEPLTIISDSTYVTHTIQKEWYKNWENKDWITAVGEPVKNADLWKIVVDLMEDVEVTILHISSHVISVGKVTAGHYIESGKYEELKNFLYSKYVEPGTTAGRKIVAKENFKVINGIDCPEDSFREMVVCNTIVDAIVDNVKSKLDSFDNIK